MTSTIVEEVATGPVAGHFTRVSWGALFAGAVTAVAVWMLLYSIGVAAGLSAIDPNDVSSAKLAGIGTGIWSIIAPLLALFVGGYVASRFAGIHNRGDGVLHGVVVWGLTSIAGVMAIGMMLSGLATALGGIGNTALSAAGMATQSSTSTKAGGGGLSALGIDENALVGPVNQRLRAQGLPPVTPEQLSAATKDALQQSVRTGRVDREAIATALAQNTAMSRTEADQAAQGIEQQLHLATQKAQQTALSAADKTGKVFWGVSAALLLGLISSVAGAALAAGPVRPSRRERRMQMRPATTTT